MATQRIDITLPSDLVRKFKQDVPLRSRSKFIAQALIDKLKYKKDLEASLIRGLKANKKLDDEIARDWEAVDLENWPEW